MVETLVIDVDKTIEADSLEAVYLVDILLDSHTEFLAQRDINIGTASYTGVIKSITGIKSSKEIDAGIEQSKAATIVIANSEFRFSDILEFQEIYNRKVLIREIYLDVDGTLLLPGRAMNLMVGVIDNYSWDNNDFSISILDISRKIYADLPKYTIQKDVWPNAVDVGKPYPIIGGLVTKVPIYLVDNVEHQYLACLIPSGHTIKSAHGDGTFKVYWLQPQSGSPGSSTGGDWSVVDDSNYTVSKTTDTNGVGVFIIDFTSPFSDFTLSIDIEGIEDITPSTYTSVDGSLITNHADFVRFLFSNSDCLNVPSSDINVPSFIQARRDLDNNYTNSPTLSFWLGEIKDSLFIMEDISLAMRRSMPAISTDSTLRRYDGSWSYDDGTFFYDGGSAVKLNIIPNTITAPYIFTADENNIISNVTISKKRITDLKNDITINADKNHAQGEFRLSSNKPSTASQTTFKTLKPFTYNCLTLSNQAELDELTENIRDFEKTLPFIANFTLNASGLNLKTSDLIALTYNKAPGKSFDQYDSGWSYDSGEFFYSINRHIGWYKKKGKILSLNKKKVSVDIEMQIL